MSKIIAKPMQASVHELLDDWFPPPWVLIIYFSWIYGLIDRPFTQWILPREVIQ